MFPRDRVPETGFWVFFQAASARPQSIKYCASSCFWSAQLKGSHINTVELGCHGDLVLDFFLGSRTSLIAAERVGRHFRGVDIDLAYVDVAIERWRAMTGKDPDLVRTGRDA